MNYNVVLLQPPEYVYAQALWDVCRLVHYGIDSLGLPTTLRTNELDPASINIILGYHLVADPAAFGNCRIIFYQLEQLSDTEGWFTPRRFEVLKRAEEIWDYSPENIEFLKSKGLSNVKLLPMGFHDRLRTIPESPKEFDVLFYGTINDRRREILDRLARLCRVHVLFGVFGQQRDSFIARSRIILNVHFYAAQIIEQARLSYLINNARFVLSESADPNPFEGMIATASYDEIPETCVRFLQDEAVRQRIAEQGFQSFRLQPMMQYLKPVLGI